MSRRLEFADEASAPAAAAPGGWKVLVVDDDPSVHAVTRLMLNDFQFEERPAVLLQANSSAEARPLLRQHPDIALVLLDVVMETDHAGLDLVRHIRENLGNATVRIALRTGQPGLAPEHKIVSQYSIDDYVLKSDLTYLRVQTLVTSALRTFSLLRRLEKTQIELTRANAELGKLALTDPLTGLWNRRHFDVEIEREWRRTLRRRVPTAALMFDVDYFKSHNDSQGHQAGDWVLQQIAKILADAFRRAGDTVFRYGGEEFLALLPGTLLPDALEIAERVRYQVEALAIHHVNSPYGVVTISAGCAVADPRLDSGDVGHDALINAADRALYRAKHAGRNRVESGAPSAKVAGAKSSGACSMGLK